MKIIFKITAGLLRDVRADLARPHAFTAERVGFLVCKVATLSNGGLLLLAGRFHSVEDNDYLEDPTVGAMMGAAALRKALQRAYNEPVSMFHVHTHDHHGTPWFSRTDLAESSNFVPDFWHVRPKFPHGTIVLSLDSAAGLCWIQGKPKPIRISQFVVVGHPMRFVGDGR